MEDVLEIYHMPYDPEYPVVCMDEPCKQMIGEVREPIPCAPGQPARIDDEYVRNGVAEIELSVLKGQCLDRRIPDMATMQTQVAAWKRDRNNSARKITWQFTTLDARIN